MKDTTLGPPRRGPVLIEVRYGHNCAACGRRIRRGAWAWWTPPNPQLQPRDGGGHLVCRRCHAGGRADE